MYYKVLKSLLLIKWEKSRWNKGCSKSCPTARFLYNQRSKFSSSIYLAVPACGSSSGLAHWHVSALGREGDHLEKKDIGIRLWHVETTRFYPPAMLMKITHLNPCTKNALALSSNSKHSYFKSLNCGAKNRSLPGNMSISHWGKCSDLETGFWKLRTDMRYIT